MTSKAVVLRYCDPYGWNDERSKNYCRPIQRNIMRNILKFLNDFGIRDIVTHIPIHQEFLFYISRFHAKGLL